MVKTLSTMIPINVDDAAGQADFLRLRLKKNIQMECARLSEQTVLGRGSNRTPDLSCL